MGSIGLAAPSVIVIDTHIWVWWSLDPERLNQRQQAALATHDTVGVCSVSCWEIAYAAQRGRLKLPVEPRQWLEDAVRFNGVRLLDITPEIAVVAAALTDFQGDPFDRMMVATARVLDCRLLTADSRIVKCDHVMTL